MYQNFGYGRISFLDQNFGTKNIFNSNINISYAVVDYVMTDGIMVSQIFLYSYSLLYNFKYIFLKFNIFNIFYNFLILI